MTYDIISKRVYKKNLTVKEPDDVFKFLKSRYGKCRQEHFFVISLNSNHDIIGINISTIGITNRTIVHPREIFYHLIKNNSTSFIVSHNHTSGNLFVSPEDKDVTNTIKETSKIMGFNFLDHIIFNKNYYLSMKKEGYF